MPAKKAASSTAKKPPKEYLHVVMARHPMTGQPMPVSKPFSTEEDAYTEAVKRNENKPNLQHHVKKIEKGKNGRTT